MVDAIVIGLLFTERKWTFVQCSTALKTWHVRDCLRWSAMCNASPTPLQYMTNVAVLVLVSFYCHIITVILTLYFTSKINYYA